MFRAYDRAVVNQLLSFREHRRYVPGLVGWLGVPVKRSPSNTTRAADVGRGTDSHRW